MATSDLPNPRRARLVRVVRMLLRAVPDAAPALAERAARPAVNRMAALEPGLLAVLRFSAGLAGAMTVIVAMPWFAVAGDHRLLGASLGGIVAVSAGFLWAARDAGRRWTGAAFAAAVTGWPLLLAGLALSAPTAGGESPGIAFAVVAIVAASTIIWTIPGRAAVGWLAVAASLVLVAGLARDPGTGDLEVPLGMLVCGLIEIEARRLTEQLWESRRRTTLFATRVLAGESLEAAAERILEELARAHRFDLLVVELFEPSGDLLHLAHITRVPDPDGIDPGTPIRGPIAALARQRAAEGPWIQDLANPPRIVELETLFPRELRALALAPVRHGDRTLGLVGGGFVGGPMRSGVALAADALPLLVDVAAVAGVLLAPHVELRRTRTDEADRLRATIDLRRFAPVFQPIVDLRETRIVGYEALTRFSDGERPDVQFARAARLGLGSDLEAVTLEAAVDAAGSLPGGTWCSVNMSPEFLAGDRLSDLIACRSRPIVAEITERAVIDDYAAVREALRRLGDDIRLAVDDAGAGFASLRHVIELQPDIIKLDMALIRDIDTHPARQDMVASMRDYAVRAGCLLVAEGIETDAECATLRGIGVPCGQGYYLGRPEGLWPAVERGAA